MLMPPYAVNLRVNELVLWICMNLPFRITKWLVCWHKYGSLRFLGSLPHGWMADLKPLKNCTAIDSTFLALVKSSSAGIKNHIVLNWSKFKNCMYLLTNRNSCAGCLANNCSTEERYLVHWYGPHMLQTLKVLILVTVTSLWKGVKILVCSDMISIATPYHIITDRRTQIFYKPTCPRLSAIGKKQRAFVLNLQHWSIVEANNSPY